MFQDKLQNCSPNQLEEIFTQWHEWNWSEYKYTCNNSSEEFKKKPTVTSGKLIIAVYASVIFCLYFMYMFVKSARV